MININLMYELENFKVDIHIAKMLVIMIGTYYSCLKIINKKIFFNCYDIIIFFITAIICGVIRYETNYLISIIYLILIISILLTKLTKSNIGYNILITIVSLSVNYIIFIISIIMNYILNTLIGFSNDYFNLILITSIQIIILYIVFRTKRLKHGISFLQRKIKNEYMDLLILNISAIILFTIIMLSNYNKILIRNIFFAFIIFSIIMFITIQKSLQLYYKQKLLEQDLKETKEELENKKEEIKKLEAENLNFSKTSHSLAHKQRALEYKLEQLKQKYEVAEEIEIEDRIKNISKELYNKTPEVELSKTGIAEIDDMFKYMQSECIKNNIQFQLQIKGNIYEMINNYVSKEDLTILIADHVKNAIIAINYSENINKSILVRLGKIDKIYSLYIYDSGIEFKKETLSNLGKIPSTTHADSGGTGMGFMNTFDTLKKYNASLIINEYNKPSKDNYTKSIIIKFDKRAEFKINSYREEIKKLDKN